MPENSRLTNLERKRKESFLFTFHTQVWNQPKKSIIKSFLKSKRERTFKPLLLPRELSYQNGLKSTNPKLDQEAELWLQYSIAFWMIFYCQEISQPEELDINLMENWFTRCNFSFFLFFCIIDATHKYEYPSKIQSIQYGKTNNIIAGLMRKTDHIWKKELMPLPKFMMP